ncbi:MAG TPA: hypothetical protein VGA24_04740 [Steroidobacteraceae bacterium]
MVIGVQHPGRNEVIAAQENYWRKVTETLIGPAPDSRIFVSGRAWTFADLDRVLASTVGFPSCIESIPMPRAIRPNCQNFTEARMQKFCGAGYDQRFKLIKDGVSRYMKSYVATCDRNR